MTINMGLASASDSPRENPRDDELGHAYYAEKIADALFKLNPKDSYSVSINAPWGSGKTTFANFILHYMKEKDEDQKLIFIRFDPWLYSSTDQIINYFMSEVIKEVSRVHAVGKNLNKAMSILREANKIIAERDDVPFWAKLGLTTLTFDWTSLRRSDLITLFGEVCSSLERADKRLLILVDDIDRLDQNECQMVLTAIKAIGKLPKTIYLILCDMEIVGRMIKAYNPSVVSGHEYLKKIVQFQFDLPATESPRLKSYFFKRFEGLFDRRSDCHEICQQINIFFDAYQYSVEELFPFLLDTPRAVVRLINALSLTYRPIWDEIDTLDFLLLEILRLDHPELYEAIRDSYFDLLENPYQDIKQSSPDMKNHSGEDLLGVDLIDRCLNECTDKDRRILHIILMFLFPKSFNKFKGIYYPQPSKPIQATGPRISERSAFASYFWLQLPHNIIPERDANQILELTFQSKDLFVRVLKEKALASSESLSDLSRLFNRLYFYKNLDRQYSGQF